MSSQLQLIIGPMFSGKSTELLQRCKKYNICKYNCILIKYLNENKIEQKIVQDIINGIIEKLPQK